MGNRLSNALDKILDFGQAHIGPAAHQRTLGVGQHLGKPLGILSVQLNIVLGRDPDLVPIGAQIPSFRADIPQELFIKLDGPQEQMEVAPLLLRPDAAQAFAWQRSAERRRGGSYQDGCS